MRIAVTKQTQPGETRVPMSPAVVKRLLRAGAEVSIEAGAGSLAFLDDSEYQEAGAVVASQASLGDLLSQADVVVTIHPPTDEQIGHLRDGCVLVGMLAPVEHLATIKSLAQRNVTSFSMEFVPRISRAQAMDVLSSQANIAGYKAALLAADNGPKIYPMMMTAAGTIAPSRVFVIGAGVAGLQAIATAKRLGAVVEAFDVRPVVKEQVQSLGARFVDLSLDTQDAQTEGGYAKELSQEQRARQSELMAKHVIAADAVITTAAVFGKSPPMLIPNEVVEQMHPGSVIVDLAADVKSGRGNCQATQPDQCVTTGNGVTVIGHTNLPAMVPTHASEAYANNMHVFLNELCQDGQVSIDFDNEILKGAVITHGGKTVNEAVAKALDPKPD